MSGGEQQMLAIGRALMARPKLLLLDEPSSRIAPILVDRIYRTIGEINRSGSRSCWSSRTPTGRWRRPAAVTVFETGRVALASDSASLKDIPRCRRRTWGHERSDKMSGAIGANALYFLFAWLISAAAASWLSSVRATASGSD